MWSLYLQPLCGPQLDRVYLIHKKGLQVRDQLQDWDRGVIRNRFMRDKLISQEGKSEQSEDPTQIGWENGDGGSHGYATSPSLKIILYLIGCWAG